MNGCLMMDAKNVKQEKVKVEAQWATVLVIKGMLFAFISIPIHRLQVTYL